MVCVATGTTLEVGASRAKNSAPAKPSGARFLVSGFWLLGEATVDVEPPRYRAAITEIPNNATSVTSSIAPQDIGVR